MVSYCIYIYFSMNQTSNKQTEGERAERLELYKLMVEMADRVSQRRQAANSFYLSINTLLVGGAAYLEAEESNFKNIILISLVGFLISLYWIASIESYKTLNTAKFNVINSMEQHFAVRPFTEEWAELDPDKDGKRHKPFHKTEKAVPKIFILLYAFQALRTVPWNQVISMLHC